MARYFVYGYYGFSNFGDDLLLEVLMENIRRRDSAATFVVRARAPIPALIDDPSVSFFLAESILEEQRKSRLSRFWRYRRAITEVARRCDVMVIGGGTLFIDKGKLNWSLLFLHQAARAARHAGRKVVIAGVAIDILANPFSLWLTRRIFALADFSTVRDVLSLAYFPDWKAKPRLTSDFAWLKTLPRRADAERPRRMIGLNFIDYFRTSTQSVENHEAFRRAITLLIERHRSNADFALIALQRGLGQRDDWFMEEFRALVPHAPIIYIEDDASLAAALDRVDAVVTTRFHLALLAARQGITTCIIDHELKLTSLAQELHLPSLTMAEFLMSESSDPIERLDDWNGPRTALAATRMAGRSELNFAWMSA
jgi:polysaccharide pyruvyl transferase WcaK-like protein